MNLSHFIRIDREAADGGTRHYVVHGHAPKFAMEMTIDPSAAPADGVIKSVSVPNSWAGNYGQYAKWISAAQEFFRRSFGETDEGEGPRRF